MCAAEASLGQFKAQEGGALAVLQLVTANEIPDHVRQAGAVFFKNLVKERWAPSEDATTVPPIADAVKEQVKGGLLSLILCVGERPRLQLSEAMSLIASHDFPAKWEALLPDLVSKIEAALGASPRDYATASGLLSIAHSVFSRYRHEFKSDALYSEIKYVLDRVQAPLLKWFETALADLPATASDAAGAKRLVHALTVIASLHYDLCYQDLPEFFEDNMAKWMEGFVHLLKYANPALAVDDDEVTRGRRCPARLPLLRRAHALPLR